MYIVIVLFLFGNVAPAYIVIILFLFGNVAPVYAAIILFLFGNVSAVCIAIILFLFGDVSRCILSIIPRKSDHFRPDNAEPVFQVHFNCPLIPIRSMKDDG